MSEPLLQIQNLRFAFNQNGKKFVAVDDVSFSVDTGKTLVIVGESGCGKSVTVTSILQLLPKSLGDIVGGSIRFMGQELVGADVSTLRDIRGNKISMIFQEPMTSLNPVFKIGKQMAEMQLAHKKITRKEADAHSVEMLKKVGMSLPERILETYPHQLSGGMRQRVMIAMAMSCNPLLLLADEPTTALDVTIQAQVLQLMRNLQKDTGTAIILITHDMGVVAEMADDVMVMYGGRAVEYGPVEDVFKSPRHPYTRDLLKSVPRLDMDVDRLTSIKGNVPSIKDMPPGCRYSTRCQECTEQCTKEDPGLIDFGDHSVRCWKYTAKEEA